MFRDLPVSTVDGPRGDRLRRARLTQHPWRAFLLLLALQGTCLTLVGFLLFGILRLPRQLANIEAFSAPTRFTVSALPRYGIAPFLLGQVSGPITPGFVRLASGQGTHVSNRTPRTAAVDGWRTLAGEHRDAPATEAFLQRLMSEHRVTALSVAVLDGGRTVFERTLGAVDLAGDRPADERTVFRAASLTKPVFAYLVMKLVDEGVVDLDTPLHRYLPKPLHAYPAYASFRGDARYERLTARLLLSHQGGLPNWRRARPDGPIQFHSDPGDHFAYSGEGYALLQFVIELVTGRSLPALARDKVFEPLGMDDSSFLWEPRFDGRFAVALGPPLGSLIEQTRWRANAAASLVTNAPDYAKFVAAVMNGDGLSARTRAVTLEPEVALTSRSLFSQPGTDAGVNRAHKMAWTPGWGSFEDANGRALFHVGLEEGCENFVEWFQGRRLGVVVLSLTISPDSFSAPLVEYTIGKAFSPLEWLEYGEAPSLGGSRVALLAAVVGLGVGTLVLVVILSRRRRRAEQLPL